MLVKNDLYCGGGVYTDASIKKERQLLVYQKDGRLPVNAPCPNVHFGLTSLNGKVVAIGGERHTNTKGTLSKSVWVLEGERTHETWESCDTLPQL